MSADVVLETLKQVWNTLVPLRLPMALMGGLAVAVWKHLRLTRDVVILLALETIDTETLIQQLKKAGFRPKRQPPVLRIGEQSIIQFLYQPPGVFLDIQVNFIVAEGDFARHSLKRAQPTKPPDFDEDIMVLSCEDLILHKLLAGRILDKADAAALLRANRSNLDWNYLRGWTDRLDLNKDWAFIWEEAFPGEKPTPESS